MLKTNRVSTMNPNYDVTSIRTYQHGENPFPDHKYGHFAAVVGILWDHKLISI